MPKCYLCNDFQRSPRQFRFTFDCNQAALIQSANNGCIICSLLLQGLRYFEPKLEKLKDRDRIYVWGGDIDSGGAVDMEIFSAGALKLRLEFFNTKGKNSPLEGARILPAIPGDTRAPASIDWAKQRLRQCIDSHASCGERSISKLPNRVLEICRGEREIPSVKLLSTPGVKAQYACLSHRWSKPAALVTKRSNVASHAKSIDWKTLPKTFKEAILITQDLGLQHLWVDSLCIIQDDDNDKQRELAKMSSIYTNAYITIAATHAEGEMHGCYSAGSFYHQDHRLSLKQPDSTTVEIDLYVREKIAHIGEQDAITPLLQRGWVCQERLLSPRVLHFCEKELVWECQESSTCQCSCFDPSVRLKQKYWEIFRHVEPVESNATIVAVNDARTSDAAHSIQDSVFAEFDRFQKHIDNNIGPRQEAQGIKAGVTGMMNTGNAATNTACVSDPVSGSFASADSPTSPSPNPRRARERFLRFRRKENRTPPVAPPRAAPLQVAPLQAAPLQAAPLQAAPLQAPPPGILVPYYTLSHPFPSRQDHIPSRDDDNDVIWRWRHILSDYSGMDLTEESDRLPAIAGIASQVGEAMNSKYLAGLWEKASPGDLLWRTDYTIEPRQQRPQYKAPSWSWASVDGKIKHCKLKSYHPEFFITRAVCHPVSDINPFGKVTTGWLEVHTRSAPLLFTLNLAEDKTLSRRRVKVEFLGDNAVFVPDYDISVGPAAKYARMPELHKKEYHFLCVGDFCIEWNDAIVARGGGSYDLSLVLQRVDEGKYERVGILERNPREPKVVEDAHLLAWSSSPLERKSLEQKRDVWRLHTGIIIV
ncbi:HET-domain-containing protein [Curvularia clavata]|uniref:HET-domain-containing protein n=1 Tax=Curvularia clavata TaxID=95742 RepID=A0A9Q8Z205_CURCL|nr:HET-domain-containing protein [Curvularia clavata]